MRGGRRGCERSTLDGAVLEYGGIGAETEEFLLVSVENLRRLRHTDLDFCGTEEQGRLAVISRNSCGRGV